MEKTIYDENNGLWYELQGVTEQLKAQDQMLWVQRMNNIRDRAMKIVMGGGERSSPPFSKEAIASCAIIIIYFDATKSSFLRVDRQRAFQTESNRGR